MRVEYSESESRRFGLKIGRLVLARESESADLESVVEGFDLVIIRSPASLRQLPSRLASMTGYRVIPADNLCYWDWQGDRISRLSGWQDVPVRVSNDTDELEKMINDSFVGYRNHYAVNPILGQEHIIPGYVEWACNLLASGTSSLMVIDASDGLSVGFGLVDWSPHIAEIRLAGMRSRFQGRGLYPHILVGIIREALARGRGHVRISSQSDNIKVMRAWARLGFLPTETISTFHLVKGSLLVTN